MVGNGARTHLYKVLSGDPATRYYDEHVIQPLAGVLGTAASEPTIIANLKGPRAALNAIYKLYAFNRRGRERRDLSCAASTALGKAMAEDPHLLSRHDGERVWSHFAIAFMEQGGRPSEGLERGPIQGLAELAQELNSEYGQSIATWIWTTVQETGCVRGVFDRIVDIRGVGPKVCSALIRDLVQLGGLEDTIHFSERLYVQPIDKWVRLAAPYVVEELAEEDAADWILAGKIAKYARRAGVSGIAFNMGTSYVGRRSGSTPMFERQLEELCRQVEPIGSHA